MGSDGEGRRCSGWVLKQDPTSWYVWACFCRTLPRIKHCLLLLIGTCATVLPPCSLMNSVFCGLLLCQEEGTGVAPVAPDAVDAAMVAELLPMDLAAKDGGCACSNNVYVGACIVGDAVCVRGWVVDVVSWLLAPPSPPLSSHTHSNPCPRILAPYTHILPPPAPPHPFNPTGLCLAQLGRVAEADVALSGLLADGVG